VLFCSVILNKNDFAMQEFQYELKELLEIGNSLAERGEENEAIKLYLSALNLAEQLNDPQQIKLLSNLVFTLM
jgi:hypothetical protein